MIFYDFYFFYLLGHACDHSNAFDNHVVELSATP